jgi:hypothetical protein
MLVRYPELATVGFEPSQQSLCFTFLLTGGLEDKEFARARESINASLQVYHQLVGNEQVEVDLSALPFGGLLVFEMRRDVDSLCQEEVSLLVELVRGHFGERLIVEDSGGYGEDEMILQEELIEEMLADLRDSGQEKDLIAIREEGRVMVFNK